MRTEIMLFNGDRVTVALSVDDCMNLWSDNDGKVKVLSVEGKIHNIKKKDIILFAEG